MDQQIRSKDNYKYSFQNYTQMVITTNGKYFRINIKIVKTTNSRGNLLE